MNFWAALYFTTFLVLSSVILLNIVMAVLVDEFVRSVEREKQADRLEHMADLSAQSCLLNTLDPLLRELCISSPNLDAINGRIADLFRFCDVDESGDINYQEFRDGLRKLPFDLPFSAEDWDIFASCGEELSAPMFLEAMQQQLNLYIHRLFLRTIEVEPDSSVFSVLLLVLKFQSMPASNAGEGGFLESNEIDSTSRTLTPTETFDLPPAVCSKCAGRISANPALDTLHRHQNLSMSLVPLNFLCFDTTVLRCSFCCCPRQGGQCKRDQLADCRSRGRETFGAGVW